MRITQRKRLRARQRWTPLPEWSKYYQQHTNIFRADLIHNLTVEIAEDSIYEYIENSLKMQIATSKRQVTVERATKRDELYLDLGIYDCLAVISGQTINADGVLFEYTQSRHHPDYFCFLDTAVRSKG